MRSSKRSTTRVWRWARVSPILEKGRWFASRITGEASASAPRHGRAPAAPHRGRARSASTCRVSARQPQRRESFEPTQRGSLVTRRVRLSYDLAEEKRSASESPPISRAAISAARTCPRWMARWKRPCASALPCHRVMPLGPQLKGSRDSGVRTASAGLLIARVRLMPLPCSLDRWTRFVSRSRS
jgi:hypothetical protein